MVRKATKKTGVKKAVRKPIVRKVAGKRAPTKAKAKVVSQPARARKYVLPGTTALIAGVIIIALKVFMVAWSTCDYIDFAGQASQISLNTQIGAIVLDVEVMDSAEERARGLMYREKLPEDQGMLFLFPKAAMRSFWMKNVQFPIDILFFNGERKMVGAVENVLPCVTDPCEYYRSVAEAQYVLEVNAGFVAGNLVEVRDELDFVSANLVKWERCRKIIDN